VLCALATCGARTEDVPSSTAGCHLSRGPLRAARTSSPATISIGIMRRRDHFSRAARRPALHPHVTVAARVLPSGRDAGALAAGRLFQVSSPLI
jgi:hypothetical protein